MHRNAPAPPIRHSTRPGANRARGFTVLEMAVSVGVIGVLAALVSTAYSGIADARDRSRARAEAEVARQAVRAFMLQHHRLPCPDFSDDGDGAREGLAGSCPAGAQVGWLPYESLGLARPEPARRMRYAVARSGADLVEPTGGTGTRMDGTSHLRATLASAAAAAPGSTRPFLTDHATPDDCGHVAANPAFVLVAPVSDRDDAGSEHPGFDGVNRAMADAGALCIATPERPMEAGYDDVVVAESASSLLGWLVATTR